MYVTLLIRYFGGDHMYYARSQSSLYLILQFLYLFLLFLIDFVILCILDSAFIHFDYSWNIISRVKIYMLYCYDI